MTKENYILRSYHIYWMINSLIYEVFIIVLFIVILNGIFFSDWYKVASYQSVFYYEINIQTIQPHIIMSLTQIAILLLIIIFNQTLLGFRLMSINDKLKKLIDQWYGKTNIHDRDSTSMWYKSSKEITAPSRATGAW